MTEHGVSVEDFQFAGTSAKAILAYNELGQDGRDAAWWFLALELPFLLGYGLLLCAGCAFAARRLARIARGRVRLGRRVDHHRASVQASGVPIATTCLKRSPSWVVLSAVGRAGALAGLSRSRSWPSKPKIYVIRYRAKEQLPTIALMETHSWLIGNGSDRERMLDMDRRLGPVRLRTFGVLALALLASGPWVGWWTIAPLLLAAGLFRLADTRIESTARPEYWMFGAWAGATAIIALSVAVTGRPAVSMLAVLAIPVVTLSARFSSRGILIGVATVIGLMIAVAFGTNSHAVLENPPLLVVPIAVAVAVAMLSTALMHSDVEHRSKAVIDQLTGLLNRNALEARANELEQQSAITGEPIAVILGDFDDFKAVNDSAGHTVGDAVLRDVAYLLRKRLRAFDLAYRLGGDEFLVLVPGSDFESAATLADELREAIAAETVGGGLRVTMSFGVGASQRGESFDYHAIFRSADAALYEAKHCGDRASGNRSSALVSG